MYLGGGGKTLYAHLPLGADYLFAVLLMAGSRSLEVAYNMVLVAP